MRRFCPRRVTIAVPVVRRTARSRELAAARRLSKLPDGSKWHPAGRGWPRFLLVGAARRRRAGIVVNEERDTSFSRPLVDVPSGHDFSGAHGNSGAVDSGTKTRRRNAIRPGQQIRHLVGFHFAAFLLVQENYGAGAKTLPRGHLCREARVGRAKHGRVRRCFQLVFKPSIKQHEESETVPSQYRPLPGPWRGRATRRFVEPVTRERECFF